MPLEEQRHRILEALAAHTCGLTRDWFAVELRPAFDKLCWDGEIEATGTYQMTAKGRETFGEAVTDK